MRSVFVEYTSDHFLLSSLMLERIWSSNWGFMDVFIFCFFFFVMTKDLLFCYFYSCESLLLSCIILLDFIEIMCVCARVYVYIWRYIPLVILSWSWFHSLAISTSQAIRIKYLHPDSELQNYALQVMEMLRAETSVDAHALVFFSIICSFYLFYDVHFIEIKWQR